MMGKVFRTITLFVCLAFATAFQKLISPCRIPMKLYGDESGKGFGKKKEAVKVSDQKQPFNTRLNPAEESATNAISSSDIKVEEKRSYITPRARREAELDEKIARLKEEEDLLSTDPSVGAVPELVADRMIGRIVAFFGIPVFGGLAIFVGAFFYSKKYDVVVPPSIIAYATQVPFVLGLVGISYAILSSSWDEEPGSLLGFKEFGINFQRIKEGLDRTRENAELKDDIQKESEKLGRK